MLNTPMTALRTCLAASLFGVLACTTGEATPLIPALVIAGKGGAAGFAGRSGMGGAGVSGLGGGIAGRTGSAAGSGRGAPPDAGFGMMPEPPVDELPSWPPPDCAVVQVNWSPGEKQLLDELNEAVSDGRFCETPLFQPSAGLHCTARYWANSLTNSRAKGYPQPVPISDGPLQYDQVLEFWWWARRDLGTAQDAKRELLAADRQRFCDATRQYGYTSVGIGQSRDEARDAWVVVFDDKRVAP
ncbi:MAG: hypothetical protein RL701_2416 [Pseudomonadota bacterium]|jgi:hypothetical protein